MLAKSIKAFLAQTYSDEIKPVDVFKTSALEYSIDGEDPREVRGARLLSAACSVIAILIGGRAVICPLGTNDRHHTHTPPTPTPTTPPQELPTLISRSKAEVESELGDAPPMIYTLPDSLQARLVRACVAHRQAAAGLKKKVTCPRVACGGNLCVFGRW